VKAETHFGIGDAHGIVIVHRFALARLQEGVVEEGFRLKRLSVLAHIERLSCGMPCCRVYDLIGNVNRTLAVFGFVAADGSDGQDGDDIKDRNKIFHNNINFLNFSINAAKLQKKPLLFVSPCIFPSKKMHRRDKKASFC
jgi:hypothetical protein